MIDHWDEEEEVKDAKTWETAEGGENAFNYILKKYLWFRGDKKIDRSKPWDDAINLITNIILFDTEFHQFALDNYQLLIKYDEKKNFLDIIKIKY